LSVSMDLTSHVPVSLDEFQGDALGRAIGKKNRRVLSGRLASGQRGSKGWRASRNVLEHWSCECLGCFNIRADFRHCAVAFRLKVLCHLSRSV